MVSKLLTRNCKRCDSQYITTDVRKIFCGKSCAQKYSSLQQHVRKRNRPDGHEDKVWVYKIKRTYGITEEEYNRMFREQKGCCAICNTHQDKIKVRLCVDHCHKTNRVRKLLCSNCNRGLGMFQDNPKLLKKAMEYLL